MTPTLHAVLTGQVNRILDHFRECFGIKISFLDTEGRVVKSGMDKPSCRYCQFVQKLYGPERCYAEDAAGCERSLTEGMHSYTCHAGLVESTVPLYCDGCLVGYAMIGQIRITRKLPKDIERDWRRAFEKDDLRQAFFNLELVSQQRLDSVLDLFNVVVDYIMSHRLVTISVSPFLQEVLDYMREHVHDRLSIQDIADIFATSSSTLTHAFCRELGVSFKRMFIEMKLEKAEQLMRENPAATISVLAHQLGYDDPYYFSRLYKAHRGQPPKAFLANLKKPNGASSSLAQGVAQPPSP